MAFAYIARMVTLTVLAATGALGVVLNDAGPDRQGGVTLFVPMSWREQRAVEIAHGRSPQ